MEPQFWLERWEKGMTAFHLPEVNPSLERHVSLLAAPSDGRVLVPLCGKSLDLMWLVARGYQVCAVELSPIAARAVFEQAGVAFSVSELYPGFETFSGPGLDIHVGDWFEASAGMFEGVKCTYDRAALVALPPALRAAYVTHLVALCPNVTSILLVTLEYEQSMMDGPPFSVTDTDVASLYGRRFALSALSAEDVLSREARFAQRGLTQLAERVWHLTPQ